jgi:hypothetical protein
MIDIEYDFRFFSSIIQICTDINDSSGKSLFVLMFSGLKVKVMSLNTKQ